MKHPIACHDFRSQSHGLVVRPVSRSMSHSYRCPDPEYTVSVWTAHRLLSSPGLDSWLEHNCGEQYVIPIYLCPIHN